jgi:hypothetical protein
MLRLGEHLNSSIMFSELILLIVVYIFSVLYQYFIVYTVSLGNGTSLISS